MLYKILALYQGRVGFRDAWNIGECRKSKILFSFFIKVREEKILAINREGRGEADKQYISLLRDIKDLLDCPNQLREEINRLLHNNHQTGISWERAKKIYQKIKSPEA